MRTIEIDEDLAVSLEDMFCEECNDFNSVISALDHNSRETLPRLASKYKNLVAEFDAWLLRKIELHRLGPPVTSLDEDCWGDAHGTEILMEFRRIFIKKI